MQHVEWTQTDKKSTKILENEVQLWKIKAVQNRNKISSLKKILSNEEKLKSEKFRFEKDSFTYITAHATLRLLISNYINISAKEITFKTNQYGKPDILFPDKTKLRFNLSHSNNQILIGFTLNESIGVDVEKIKRSEENYSILYHFFSEKEKEEFSRIPDQKKPETFFFSWNCKEAFVKATGKGLSLPLNSFAISIESLLQPKIVLNDYKESIDWNIKTFFTDKDFSSSVVVSGEISNYYFFDAENIVK